MKYILLLSALYISTVITSCNNSSSETSTTADSTMTLSIKEEPITYTTSDGVTCKGYITYDENKKGTRPAVLVVPEWWGLNDYSRSRAKQLAGLGYIAMAVDMYGDGKQGNNPDDAMALAMPFYKDPSLTKTRLDGAYLKLKEQPQTDAARIAAIGYCFGGFVVLNAAKQGEPLNGIVSFHGGLGGVPADKNLMRSKILVCHGDSDKFVPQTEVDAFKKSMDSIGAYYVYKSYENATHAFTNPDATANGKKFNMPIEYNAAADTASWNDMKNFFDEIFK